MLCLRHTPAPPLDAFIASLWLIEGCELSHAFERVLPSGDMSIIINLYEDATRTYDARDLSRYNRLAGSILCGPHSRFVVVDAAELRDTMGVQFKPGGAFPFFKLPMGELENAHLSLSDLWGADGHNLRERLLEAPTPAAKFGLLEDSLRRRIARPLDPHPAVRFALGCFHREPEEPISKVTERLGYSDRHFIQSFSDRVGFTPKRYCRLLRFQKALSMSFAQPQLDWTSIAIDCGYFDQSHFIHDFSSFSGLTPTAYLAQRAQPGNHVPLAIEAQRAGPAN